MSVKRKKSPYFVTACITILSTIFLYVLTLMPFYNGISNSYTDFRWTQIYDQSKADSDIVVIAIDQNSIKKISEKLNFNWPWPRQFYGIVLDYLKEAKSETVIFDILFDESEVGRMDISGEESEAYFSDAISRYKKVVLGNMVQDTISDDFIKISKNAISFENSDKYPIDKEYKSLSVPIEKIRKDASMGVVKFNTDADGVCRRSPLLYKVNGKFFPQLAFSAYLQNQNDKVVKYDYSNEFLITTKSKFKLKDGNYIIKWYGPANKPYKYYSFYDIFRSATQVMQGQTPVVPLDELKGKKIVFFATATGLLDFKSTPFSSMGPYPGGEIHTTLLDNLLNSNFIYEIPFYQVLIATMLILFAISYLFIKKSLSVALTSVALTITAIVFSDYFLFKSFDTHFDLMFPIISVIFTSSGTAMFRLFSEGTEKRQIKSMFSRYLSKDVINILMENPDKVDLEGSEYTGTVLFTDLQGFTTYAEDKTPQQLINTLNRYFQILTDIVLAYKGLLDKYTGDGIMAIFGAPLPSKHHARAACEVILTFRDQKVNELISTKDGNILTRIGICSGPIVVGNLGSDKRMDYTAIGDTVNLSARLEGVNKAYGTTNMLSESTWELVKDDYFFRELDLIRVKGKNKPIRVFTLIDRKDNISKELSNIEKSFTKALEVYRGRDWDNAIKSFETVIELNPEDLPSKAFIERCNLLKKNPDLVDSDGVFTFKTK
ncbi:MAG: adenylate/guanylate cyclase domain-containing protein [Desulfobacterales bacterium]|nr:adenylate/guanylate cyclase domain-containing protein [Desulfobacterales bacterium]